MRHVGQLSHLSASSRLRAAADCPLRPVYCRCRGVDAYEHHARKQGCWPAVLQGASGPRGCEARRANCSPTVAATHHVTGSAVRRSSKARPRRVRSGATWECDVLRRNPCFLPHPHRANNEGADTSSGPRESQTLGLLRSQPRRATAARRAGCGGRRPLEYRSPMFLVRLAPSPGATSPAAGFAHGGERGLDASLVGHADIMLSVAVQQAVASTALGRAWPAPLHPHQREIGRLVRLGAAQRTWPCVASFRDGTASSLVRLNGPQRVLLPGPKAMVRLFRRSTK